MKKRPTIAALLEITGCFLVAQTNAAIGVDFYQSKTLRPIVGSAPDGGYDTYTRMDRASHPPIPGRARGRGR